MPVCDCLCTIKVNDLTPGGQVSGSGQVQLVDCKLLEPQLKNYFVCSDLEFLAALDGTRPYFVGGTKVNFLPFLPGAPVLQAAEAVQAAQVVAEDHFMSSLSLDPVTIVGYV